MRMMTISGAWMRWILVGLVVGAGPGLRLRADHAELVQRFLAMGSGAVWPVQGGSFDDIEETFGPRRQPSNNGAYAVHLHFELRVGTQSSLEFQLANFSTNSPSFNQTEVVVPRPFMASLEGEGYARHVVVADIWGRTAEHPAPPALRIESGPGTVHLAWPVEHWGYQLERSSRDGLGEGWSLDEGAPSVGGNMFRYVLPAENGAGFLRLRRP